MSEKQETSRKSSRWRWIEVLLVAAILYLLAGQWMLSHQAKQMEGHALPALTGRLSEVLAAHPKTVLYFHSPTCPACRLMNPSMERIAARHKNFYAIDITREPELAQKFRIMGTPTLVLANAKGIQTLKVGFQLEGSVESLFE